MTAADPVPLPLQAYRLATAALAPALPLWLAWRARRGKEETARLPERSGMASRPRPAGRLIWCHAASVGESLALRGLIEALAARGFGVLVTTGTVTSAALMAERLPPGAFHQYVPLDHRPWVRRFLDHWRPALVLWAESELWPNALAEIAGRGIPAVLVNARLSARSYRGWRRWPGTAGAVLRTFAAVLAQSPEDAQRFAALGARGVRCVGNLKAAAAALPVDETALSAMKAAIGARPAWLAASIHPGEDRIVADTHRALAPRHPGLLSIVVPRHPDKAEAMAALIAATGLRVARRSGGAVLTPDCDVYMADTLGELGLWYRACDLVFVGKSFAVGGGQNPAEPAKLGCAIVCGPDMSNFADLAARLRDAGALRVAETPAALVAILADLLGDPARRRALGAAAAQVLSAEGTALAETLAVLEPWLAVPIDCP